MSQHPKTSAISEYNYNLPLEKIELNDLHLIPYQDDSKWGYITLENELAIPCIYSSVKEFKNGYAIVSKRNKYGVINKKNEKIISFEYNDIEE